MELKICHLYPDVLNLYGDGGNIRCLTQRLNWRGIGVEVTKMPIGSKESLTGFDLIIHCGACMLGETEVASRYRKASEQGVPMTNYGIAIGKMKGILARVIDF